MPNTFTQCHFQFMFPVKYRLATLQPPWDEELRKYITGIFRNNGHKMLAINNVEDHIHIFGGLSPDQSISNLMRDVKSSSTVWINDNKFTSRPFQWQTGYGAFSYSKSDIDSVVKYIQNQKEYHKTVSFDEEFKEFLKIFGVIYEDRYLFHPLLEG
jgi:REP-associated tyrosine transposase